ncbi:uncharacterized protein H6S33_002969 [Morchella sextelata]|jgi:hypothetical protein|uniref:uncharacterized protein n=1 Tax=Morchella sextelata TaxID=1174677 RepID=UPI001D04422C|nr:uncharacterized protein H6S33_002969 [Morchella sextelata]KAH0606981.1 hypothetical protein H6S33_002969 [Morchella sextelata]
MELTTTQAVLAVAAAGISYVWLCYAINSTMMGRFLDKNPTKFTTVKPVVNN